MKIVRKDEHLEGRSAIEVVVLVCTQLGAAYVRLQRIQVFLKLLVADQAVARTELHDRRMRDIQHRTRLQPWTAHRYAS